MVIASNRASGLLTRRGLLGGGAALGCLHGIRVARAETAFQAPPALVEAARKEGKLVIYTANFAEVMQDIVKAFNKRFPFVRADVVRGPGGQILTRVKSEAAAGKLIADVVDHSDRGLMAEIDGLFMDYAPPNAGDFLPGALASPKFWPSFTQAWVLAWNTELVKNPPKNWMDLCKPEYGDGRIGQVIGPSGGTTWTRIMFERQVLGEDYWARQAATKPRLFPSAAPLADSLVRGEVQVAPLTYSIIPQKKRDGAPIASIFAPEGVPIVPLAAGIPKTAANPNAARLFLDWLLSAEGQGYVMREQGSVSALKTWPVALPGFDPAVNKLWLPEFKPFQDLLKTWMEEWNRIYGYRQ